MQTTLQLSVSDNNKKQEQQHETVPASDVDISENIRTDEVPYGQVRSDEIHDGIDYSVSVRL